MEQSPQKTLTAITLKVGKIEAYTNILKRLKEIAPAAEMGTVSASWIIEDLVNQINAANEELQND